MYNEAELKPPKSFCDCRKGIFQFEKSDFVKTCPKRVIDETIFIILFSISLQEY